MTYLLSCETEERGGGVYAYSFDQNGLLKQAGYFPCDRPMYAVKCKNGLCVLLREPFGKGGNSGYFYLDEGLQTATQVKSTQGIVACHLCVDEHNVYIVNYSSGNIVKNGEKIAQRIGKSVHLTRQTQSHPHFVGVTPDGYLAVCDLGMDTLSFYDKELHFISERKVPSGYGIRHLVFSKCGSYIYAVKELVPSVSVFAYRQGNAQLLHTLLIPCKNENANGAAIRLSEDGRYLYLSLREENAICVYGVKEDKLELLQTVDCGGDGPRDFNLFGEALVCCNEKSGTVTQLAIKDGLLFEGKKVIELANPLNVF